MKKLLENKELSDVFFNNDTKYLNDYNSILSKTKVSNDKFKEILNKLDDIINFLLSKKEELDKIEEIKKQKQDEEKKREIIEIKKKKLENDKLKIKKEIDEKSAKIAEIENEIKENKDFLDLFESLDRCNDLVTCNKILNGSNYIDNYQNDIKKLENDINISENKIKKLKAKQLETKQLEITQLQNTLSNKKEQLDKYIQKLVKYKDFIIEIFKANKDQEKEQKQDLINFFEKRDKEKKTTNAIFKLTDDELKLFKRLYKIDEKNKITNNLNLDIEKENLIKEIEKLTIKLEELNSRTI